MPWLRNSEGRTPRQQQAYDLWTLDYSTKEIAKIMGISQKRAWGLLNIDKLHKYHQTPKAKASAKESLRKYRAKKREEQAKLFVEKEIPQVDIPETPRQQEAYDLWQLDLPTKEIARRLGLKSPAGVWSLLRHVGRRKYFGKGKKHAV